MKSILLSLFICLTCITLSAQESILNQPINITFENIPLEEALIKLSQQQLVNIAFSNNQIPDKKISQIFDKQTFKIVLDNLLVGTKVKYKVTNNQIILFKADQKTQKYIISGFIKDAETGEGLIGSNVLNPRSLAGTSSNNYGFYSLTVPEGIVSIEFSYLGYNNEIKSLELKDNLTLNVDLTKNFEFPEIVVVDSISRNKSNPFELSTKLPLTQLSALPKFGGQEDVLRSLHFISGIKTGSDGIGGLHVRGGSPDQNLIMLDGATVYNANHALGLLSIFNSGAIKETSVYKGDSPAKFSGRLSSVIDVRTKEGNSKEFKGEIGLGLISTNAQLEGPIIKDKSSFFISARRSILDLFIKDVSARLKRDENKNRDGFLNYFFYDINAKVNYNISDETKLFISYYRGKDFYENNNLESFNETNLNYQRIDDQSYDWGNEILSLRLNSVLSKQLFMNSSFTLSSYLFESAKDFEIKNVAEINNILEFTEIDRFNSKINDVGVRFDFEYMPSQRHHLNFGISYLRHSFRPGVFFFSQDIPVFDTLMINIPDFSKSLSDNSQEINFYLDDEFIITPFLKFQVGANSTLWRARRYQQIDLQPKLSMLWLINKSIRFRLNYSKSNQYIHLLNGSGIGLPSDLWVPATEKILPQIAHQWLADVDFKLGKNYSLLISAYSKKMRNLVAYKPIFGSDDSFTLDAESWENEVVQGVGDSKGIEFTLNKSYGKLNGNINYTLSESNRQFDAINRGLQFDYRYDRRHDFKAYVNYAFNKKFSISSTFLFSTGNAITLARNNFFTPANNFSIIGATTKNNIRLPNYHRLDLGANYKFGTAKLKQELSFGIYNVYDNTNPLYYRIKFDTQSTSPEFVQITIIPFLPYLYYNIKF